MRCACANCKNAPPGVAHIAPMPGGVAAPRGAARSQSASSGVTHTVPMPGVAATRNRSSDAEVKLRIRLVSGAAAPARRRRRARYRRPRDRSRPRGGGGCVGGGVGARESCVGLAGEHADPRGVAAAGRRRCAGCCATAAGRRGAGCYDGRHGWCRSPRWAPRAAAGAGNRGEHWTPPQPLPVMAAASSAPTSSQKP